VSTIAVTIKSDLVGLGEIMQDSSADAEGLRALINYLEACAGGAAGASVDVQTSATSPVAASGTITLATVAADDTVTIGKTTLTAKASPSGEDEFSQAGTDTVDAAGLVTKINAHSVLSKLVVASSSAGVVTVTALERGSIGNHIALASSNGTRLAVSAAYLASGAGGAESAAKTYRCGL
jgi:phage tail sheath gpL-like